MEIKFREVIPYTIQSCLVFLALFIGGYIFSYFVPSIPQELMFSMREDAAGTITSNLWLDAWNIFSHNVEVSLIMIIVGIIFGYSIKLIYGSYIPLAFNGVVIGMVAYVAISQFGIIAFILLTMIHGVIELPTVFFSAGLGVMISKRLAAREFNKATFISSIKLFIFVILPLYAISALIESFVTGGLIVPIIKHVMSLSG